MEPNSVLRVKIMVMKAMLNDNDRRAQAAWREPVCSPGTWEEEAVAQRHPPKFKASLGHMRPHKKTGKGKKRENANKTPTMLEGPLRWWDEMSTLCHQDGDGLPWGYLQWWLQRLSSNIKQHSLPLPQRPLNVHFKYEWLFSVGIYAQIFTW